MFEKKSLKCFVQCHIFAHPPPVRRPNNLRNILRTLRTTPDLCKKCFTRNALATVIHIQVFNLKVDRILIRVIHLLSFTTCHITQLICIYSKCWKWCPFISMHLSTRFTMFLATFLSVLSFFNHFRNSIFYWRLSSKFFKETLSTVGVRHRF